jgi:tripartite-type tricarboxylate transporter receptor subunit TctC
MSRPLLALALGAGLTIASATVAAADPVEDFYHGKTIRFLVGWGAGTGYDAYMRIVQRHIGAHIPGKPTVIPENMPGAGGLVMANYLYNVAPRDGTAIGLPSRNLTTDPMLGVTAAKYDALKFGWIGSVSSDTSTCLTWHTSGIDTLQDAMRREVKIAASGPQTDSAVKPHLLNALIGTKFKVYNGYPDSGAIGIAMEQREIDGFCGFTLGSIRSARPQWLEQHLINLIAQMAPQKHPDLKDVPNVLDMLKDEESRQAFLLVFGAGNMGRPVAAPPGVPPERLQALRTAFDETVKDPEFLDDVKKSNVDVDQPRDGAYVEKTLRQLYATPKNVIDRVTAIRNRVE